MSYKSRSDEKKEQAKEDRELEIRMEQAALAEADKAEAEKGPTANVDTKGLQKTLEKEGIDFRTFAAADEHYRKRVLKDKYEDTKLKHGWLYDQPISTTQ